MLYSLEVAVISDINAKRINARCGHNVEFFIVTPDGTEFNARL
jgi:hypothetical protein